MLRHLLVSLICASILIGPLPAYSDSHDENHQVLTEPELIHNFDPKNPLIVTSTFNLPDETDKPDTGTMSATGDIIEIAALTTEANAQINEATINALNSLGVQNSNTNTIIINNSDLPEDLAFESNLRNGNRIANLIGKFFKGTVIHEMWNYKATPQNRKLSIYRFVAVSGFTTIALVIGGMHGWHILAALARGAENGYMSKQIQYYSDFMPWNRHKNLNFAAQIPMYVATEFLYFGATWMAESTVNSIAMSLHFHAPFIVGDPHKFLLSSGIGLAQAAFEFAAAKITWDAIAANPGDNEVKIAAIHRRNVTSALASATFVCLLALRNISEKLGLTQYNFSMGVADVHFTKVEVILSAAALAGVTYLAYAYKIPEKMGLVKPGAIDKKAKEISETFATLCDSALNLKLW